MGLWGPRERGNFRVITYNDTTDGEVSRLFLWLQWKRLNNPASSWMRKACDDEDFTKHHGDSGWGFRNMTIHWIAFQVFQRSSELKAKVHMGFSVHAGVEPWMLFTSWHWSKTSCFTMPNNHGNNFLQRNKSNSPFRGNLQTYFSTAANLEMLLTYAFIFSNCISTNITLHARVCVCVFTSRQKCWI